MKSIFIYILVAIPLLSCEDMLEEVPKDFVSRANYYQNEADAQGALNGAYATMGPDYYGIDLYLLTELQGDFLNGRGSQAGVSNVSDVLDQQNIGRVSSSWLRLYQGINRANAVLGNVPSIENISEEVRTRILAEAHFLRALAYFELVRGWGSVPLRTRESIDLSVLEAPREPEENVYELILEDALAAESGLLSSVGNETGQASRWAAKMLLAHVYLTMENWTAAAEKAEEVINSGQFSLVTIDSPDDFYQIFGTETSTEDIMSIHHSENRQSEIQTFIHRGSAYPYNYGNGGYFAWLPDTTSFIGASWDDDDLRKEFNLYREYQNSDGEWVSLPDNVPILFKKFVTSTEGISNNSIPIYRYAEAFLFYAEASCRAEGPTSLALERLNIIKRRAYGYDPMAPSSVDYPAGMGQEEFIDAVLQERAYEFILERRRWWDLKRTGRVKEAYAAIGTTFIDERFLWPIPEDEINNNPAINQENQNPGY